MALRVFFSFHCADIMNAIIVRISGQFKPSNETAFMTHHCGKKQNPKEIKPYETYRCWIEEHKRKLFSS